MRDILEEVGISAHRVREKTLHKSAISAGDTVVVVQANTAVSKIVELESVDRIKPTFPISKSRERITPKYPSNKLKL